MPRAGAAAHVQHLLTDKVRLFFERGSFSIHSFTFNLSGFSILNANLIKVPACGLMIGNEMYALLECFDSFVDSLFL